nr:putative zinc finger, CCHC-type [Tanacetum cinerariifolium]
MARLATLTRELEGLHVKEGETVDDFATKLTALASKARSHGYELEEVDSIEGIRGAYKRNRKMEDIQGGLLLASQRTTVSFVAIEVQIMMTLDVAGKEVVSPGGFGMVTNVSNKIKATSNVTNVVSSVTKTMSVQNGISKRRT